MRMGKKPTPEPPPDAAPAAQPVSASSLNASVELPPVSENAVAAISAAEPELPGMPPPAPSPDASGEVDSAGVRFDPEKHRPKKNKHGRWISATLGRPKGGGTTPEKPAASPSIVGGEASPVSLGNSQDKYDLAAEVYCRTGYGVFDMIFAGNGEWQPANDGEHSAVKAAVARYLREKQMEDLPAGWALVLTVGVYASARVQKPNTTARIQQWTRYFTKQKTETIAPEATVSAGPEKSEQKETK